MCCHDVASTVSCSTLTTVARRYLSKAAPPAPPTKVGALLQRTTPKCYGAHCQACRGGRVLFQGAARRRLPTRAFTSDPAAKKITLL